MSRPILTYKDISHKYGLNMTNNICEMTTETRHNYIGHMSAETSHNDIGQMSAETLPNNID